MKIEISGRVVLLDDADAPIWSAHKWGVSNGYVIGKVNDRRIQLHRLLLNADAGQEVDHRDGNPLNNQRANLRLCTHAENMRNRGLR